MWISKEKWEKLVARVEQLEKDQILSTYGGEDSIGQLVPWRVYPYPNIVPINRVVSRLAEHLGLVYDQGKSPYLRFKE